MFSGCTNLTNAQTVLPATGLSECCYQQMFQRCYSLPAVPELSATTMAASACCEMFADCTSLTVAPALPATNLNE